MVDPPNASFPNCAIRTSKFIILPVILGFHHLAFSLHSISFYFLVTPKVVLWMDEIRHPAPH